MKDIKEILLKSVYGSLTPSEQAELQAWLDEREGNRALYERIRQRLLHRDSIQFLAALDTEQALRRVYARLHRRRRSWSIAAASVGMAASLLCAVWLWFAAEEQAELPIHTEMVQAVVEEEHATLTLASGEVLELGNDALTHTAEADGIEVKGTEIQVKKAPKAVGYNTLKVPHGENYSVTLPDGTKVWVNALSQLKFPSSFEGMEARIVELTGEGYFDVAPDKAHPFKVKTAQQVITVIGTAFNISAYPEEATRTTLCEGRVEVETATNERLRLLPGQQLTLTEAGETFIERVNTQLFTAWIEGIYYFDSQTLDEVFTVLARWYDIQGVTYDSANGKKELFSGKLRKVDSIETIIKVIERGSSRKIQYTNGNIEIK